MNDRRTWRARVRNPLTLWAVRAVKASRFRWRFRALPVHVGPNTRIEASTMGRHAALHDHASLIHSSLGRYSYLASFASASNAIIGSFCSIGPYAMIGLGRHPARDHVSTHPAFFSQRTSVQPSFAVDPDFKEVVPVTIGNDVWIGARALVADGVRVGDGAIIAAGAVVVGDVEPYTVVGGVPAKVIRDRFPPDVAQRVMRSRWWERDETWLLRNGSSFRNVDAFLDLLDNETEIASGRVPGS